MSGTATGITVGGVPLPGNPVRAAADSGERKAILAELEAALAYFRANPDAPLNRFGYALTFDHPHGVPGVRSAAAGLGLTAEEYLGLVRARKSFGRYVSYSISAMKSDEYR